VLIEQDGVAVRVHGDEARRTRRGLVGLLLQLDPLSHQLSLQLADICELIQPLRIAVPARVEGEDVLFEHPLKQPDHAISVLHDQPVLATSPAKTLKPNFS